jgi:glycosyltransferase involved in cell wall biosynthesis
MTMVDWPPLENPYYRRPQGYWAHWQLARMLLGRFPHLVANSHFIAKEAQKAYPTAEVMVIPNGICPGDWDPQEPSLVLEGSPRFLYWGMLWRKKGVDILLKAFALLRQRGFPDSRLYIVGDGEDEEALKDLCRKLALDPLVEFLGRVDHARLRSLIHASDIAVFPSVYEGFGIAILEAMVCGKVTVTTARGGPPEFISDGKDGILVSEWDAASLAGALDRIAGSKSLWEDMGKNAREKALRYTWQAAAPSYIDLYARLSRGASKM